VCTFIHIKTALAKGLLYENKGNAQIVGYFDAG